MKRTRLLLFSIGLLCFGGALAQSIKMEKHYDETYPAQKDGRIDIINKYGEVIIHTWAEDSVRITVQMTAEGKTTETVRKAMDKVNVVFRHVGTIITASTQVTQPGTGMLKDILTEVDDYSKNLFSSNKLTVNYEVWIPESFDLNIENRFGDIYTSSLSGDVSIDLAHGDLKTNKFFGSFTLRHSFGKSNVDFTENGTFILRGAESKIQSSVKLNIESSSSDLNIGKVDFLQLNSRNDKVAIGEVRELLAEGTFTDLNADMIMESARLDFNYGDVFITRIHKSFRSIDIIGKSADINLILDQASYIQAKIEAPEDKMFVPNSMLTLSKETVPETASIRLSGFVGNTQTTFSQLNIKSEGGQLIIAIKELPLFSNKN